MMPEIKSRKISVALDMHGCPNRCRHCWLGTLPNRTMSENDLRQVASLFRNYVRAGEERPFFERLMVSSWWREPDFSDDYQRLYELEAELSDDQPVRYELHSIWRLARDPEYPKWAKQVGPDTCQITLFGIGETNDWFYRRQGAFEDCLSATEALLSVGMKPRWQLFLTRKILPELDELMRLVDRLQLRERVQALGGEFQLFIHTPSPDGEGRKIEWLRPTLDEIQSIPAELIDLSAKYTHNDRPFQVTEAQWIEQIQAEDEQFPCAYGEPDPLWMMIQNNWDVAVNVGTMEPWWILGNLKRDSLDTIFDRFEHNQVPGFKALYSVSAKKLAQQYGDIGSQLIYDSKGDLISRWLGQYCEEHFS
jgi:hypothetical protein